MGYLGWIPEGGWHWNRLPMEVVTAPRVTVGCIWSCSQAHGVILCAGPGVEL